MNEISSVTINKLIVHQAGNAAQGGSLILSETAHDIPDEFWQQTLAHFFLKPFTSILLTGHFNVHFTQSNTHSLRLKVSESLFKLLETSVEGKDLVVGFRGSLKGNYQSDIYITAPTLEHLKMTGSSSFTFTNTFHSSVPLNIEIVGNGKVGPSELDLSDLKVMITGTGSLALSGRAGVTDVVMAGSSDFQGRNLRTEQCSVSVSGAGSAHIWCTKYMKASVNGVGSVYYRGNPRRVESKVGFTGTIQQID